MISNSMMNSVVCGHMRQVDLLEAGITFLLMSSGFPITALAVFLLKPLSGYVASPPQPDINAEACQQPRLDQ